MLAGLLHGKLDQYFNCRPYDIEDLLTSVVFGACRCVEPSRALLPFLATSHTVGGEPLDHHLTNIETVEYDFWPTWGAIDAGPGAAGSEPEVVLTMTRKDGSKAMLVIEVKLHASKSSKPTDGGLVTDQLAKYWLQLKDRAQQRNANPLGVLYITAQSLLPREELEQSQQELTDKGVGDAPLYWTSWRRFCEAVPEQDAPHPIDDCLRLLEHQWNLVAVPMKAWHPPPPPVGTWRFSIPPLWKTPSVPASAWSYGRGA